MNEKPTWRNDGSPFNACTRSLPNLPGARESRYYENTVPRDGCQTGGRSKFREKFVCRAHAEEWRACSRCRCMMDGARRGPGRPPVVRPCAQRAGAALFSFGRAAPLLLPFMRATRRKKRREKGNASKRGKGEYPRRKREQVPRDRGCVPPATDHREPSRARV